MMHVHRRTRSGLDGSFALEPDTAHAPDPEHILQIGMGFFASKTLLSAVELGLFTALSETPLTGEEIAHRLDLHERSRYDFLDALVSLGLLDREGNGPDARYGNTSLQGDVNRMLDEFRRADCVIQSVDIGGLRAGADERARPSGQEALFYMANETGGELFKDANNLRQPLERVLERTSVTYLLTFERSDLKTDVQAKSLIGMGSGESVQLALSGEGWVLVQPSEGRQVVAPR